MRAVLFPERQRRGIFVESHRNESQAPWERHIPLMMPLLRSLVFSDVLAATNMPRRWR
jgi:hypothetical protein